MMRAGLAKEVVFRELAHAVFDIADRALAGGKDLLPGENPFK